MDYVNLGSTGLKVSRICLGCMSFGLEKRRWMLALEESLPLLRQAVDAGITFFDTANMYGDGASEEATGRALEEFARREEVVIATKVYYPMRSDPNGRGLSRRAILAEVDNSLRRLRTEYIDLYQIHRWDDETPIEETLEALHEVVKLGKARYIGASTMFAWQFAKALHASERRGWTRFVSMQPHYNLLYREEEREMLGLCRDQGVAVLPWSPLARGRLARPWRDDASTERSHLDEWGNAVYAPAAEADHKVVEALGALSEARGTPPAQLALAWLLSKPAVTAPIVGVTRPGHIDDACAALAVKLSAEETAALEAPYLPHAIAGF